MDKMVWTKSYTNKMVLDKMVWTKWYGENGMDKMVWIKSSINQSRSHSQHDFSSISLSLDPFRFPLCVYHLFLDFVSYRLLLQHIQHYTNNSDNIISDY